MRGRLVDYGGGGGGEDGAKEKLLGFPVPVVQWVDSTTHRINLSLSSGQCNNIGFPDSL